MAQYKEKDEEHRLLEMPDIDTEHAAGYLIGLLQEAGLMSSNGMGPVPISWQEIESWLRTTELDLSTWEKLTIKNLSEEYVSELVQASEKNRPPPYLKAPENVDRVQVANKISNILSQFIRREPNKTEE